MSASRKRISIEAKAKICDEHFKNPNTTQAQLGQWAKDNIEEVDYVISQKTISNILSQSSTIYKQLQKNKGQSKSSKDVKFPALDKDIEIFILDMNNKNLPVNRAAIVLFARIQANSKYKMNQLPEKDRIKFSDGWLTKLFHRIDVKWRKLHGEEDSVDLTSQNITEQLKKIEELLEDYNPQNILNFDETGLYYEQQPTHTICRTAHGGTKKSKKRLTVGLLTNYDGTYKGHPIIIGTRKNPSGSTRSKGLLGDMAIGRENYVEYRYNSSAWMTMEIFKDYITRLNRSFARDNRHVAILLDNASVHKIKESFSHIKLVFLPANTTSKLQPLDAGKL